MYNVTFTIKATNNPCCFCYAHVFVALVACIRFVFSSTVVRLDGGFWIWEYDKDLLHTPWMMTMTMAVSDKRGGDKGGGLEHPLEDGRGVHREHVRVHRRVPP